MNQRLPKTLRVHHGNEIRKILQGGRRHTGTFFTLFCLSEPAAGAPIRAGFLTPKRLGGAVQRNRLRRQMRELFRVHRAELKEGHQILIMGRTSATQPDFSDLREDFLNLCRKARLLPPRDP